MPVYKRQVKLPSRKPHRAEIFGGGKKRNGPCGYKGPFCNGDSKAGNWQKNETQATGLGAFLSFCSQFSIFVPCRTRSQPEIIARVWAKSV